MIRILLFSSILFCFACSDNSGNSNATQKKAQTEYKDLKMERGRMYTEIKVMDSNGTGKPQERILKLGRKTNDPVSVAMYELVKTGLRYTGKNIKVDKIERDGSQWEIYFTSNKTPPKNLGKNGNVMVIKTLNYYIDHYNIFLDGELLHTTKQTKQTKATRDSMLKVEAKQLEKDLNEASEAGHNH